MGRRFQLAGVLLVLIALAIALFARPAAAAVTGSATPDTGLGDTGTIQVTASGFAQDGTLHTVFVLECEHGATDSSQCDANTEDGSLNSNTAGNYTNNAYTYYALPNAVFGGFSAITCDLTNPCDLVVIQDDYNNFSNPHVNIPITFSAVAATTTSPTTVPGTTSATTAPPATSAPIGGATTAVRGTSAPTGGSTTTVSGTTAVGGTTTTVSGKNATTVAGQGATIPTDPGIGGSDSGSGSGGTLPFTGPPTAAPIIAVCGLVIIVAGTLMRRVVLRVPDTGVSLS